MYTAREGARRAGYGQAKRAAGDQASKQAGRARQAGVVGADSQTVGPSSPSRSLPQLVTPPHPCTLTRSTPLSLALPLYMIRLLATSPCSSKSPGPVALQRKGKEKGTALCEARWQRWTACALNFFGFLAGVSGSRISAAAPILEPGSCHAESPNR